MFAVTRNEHLPRERAASRGDGASTTTTMAPQQSVHQLYKRLERVGKGAYGAVYKGVHIPTGNIVALKIIDFEAAEGQGEDDIGDIQREVALLTALRDAPNITKYYGCHMDGPRAWIVMELAEGGSVYSIMQASKDKKLEERFVAVIVREVLIALAYLHRVPVIHRDIKVRVPRTCGSRLTRRRSSRATSKPRLGGKFSSR